MNATSKAPAMFDFEESFNRKESVIFVQNIMWVPYLTSLIYVALLYIGRRYMESRKPFNLRILLFLWNSSLAAFSILGAMRTVPELVGLVVNKGWIESLCWNSDFADKPFGIWAYWFTLSKIVELGDTAFIVLRKQSLIFLHWYHHITVMIFCFYYYPNYVAVGRYFVTMNYTVHAIMYSYYALRSARVWIPQPISIAITSLQIVQMIVGVCTTVFVCLLKLTGTASCPQPYSSSMITLGMYFSYFVLFVDYFRRTYRRPSLAKSAKSDQVDVNHNGITSNGFKKHQ